MSTSDRSKARPPGEGARTEPSGAAGPVRFVERACPCCGSRRATAVWSGRFSDADVREHLLRFRYRVDLERVLGDEAFALARCDGCGFLYHRRVLDDEWLGRLYGEWIDRTQVDTFEESLSSGARARALFDGRRQLLKHLLRIRHLVHDVAGAEIRLLDFGCGDGSFLALASLFGFDCYGVDRSETRHAQGRERGVRIVADLAGFDALAPGPAHAVTLFQVLEHLSDPKRVLCEIGERLVPGGILVVEVPDCRDVTAPRSFEAFHAVQPLEHVNAFTPRTLRELCVRAGFEPVHRIPAHVSTRGRDVLLTEATRFLRLPRTSQYFRRR